jgi:hypothetical protein
MVAYDGIGADFIAWLNNEIALQKSEMLNAADWGAFQKNVGRVRALQQVIMQFHETVSRYIEGDDE